MGEPSPPMTRCVQCDDEVSIASPGMYGTGAMRPHVQLTLDPHPAEQYYM